MAGRHRSRFRPGLWPTLATLALLPLLAGLGIWQLQRAAEKQALYTAFQEGSDPVTVAGPAPGRALGDLPRFQAVRVEGRYLPVRQFLLDNMTDGGRAGYHVLTPFAPAGGGPAVLVDRGWVPKTFGGPVPEIGMGSNPGAVTGRISRLPRPGLELAGGEVGGGWPRVVQFPRTSELARALGMPLADRVILLDAEAPEGFLRAWRPAGFGPERHLGYAVQWFALAATLLVIYGVLGFRRTRDD